MSEVRLGRLIDETAQRDAIHVAIAPVVAGGNLQPGEHVGFLDAERTRVGSCKKSIGIVDPFLSVPVVREGQRFYMLLYPGTITSLRHEWTHPAFSKVIFNTDVNGESVAWLRNFAAQCGRSYDGLLEIGREVLESGSGVHVGDDSDSELFNSNRVPFLKHVAIVLGMMPPDDASGIYFSCAC